LDYKKTFDTACYKALSVEHYGVRGVANERMTSYLSNRKQFISQ